MFANYKQTSLRSERGIALFIAIFTLLLITAIAAGMIMLTNTDTSISSNFRDEQTAFFGSKAGLEEVRDRLRSNAKDGSGNSVSLMALLPGIGSPSNPPPLPGSANGIVYVTNPLNGETDTPWSLNAAASAYPDDELCNEMNYLNNPGQNGCNSGKPLPGPSGWFTAASANAYYAANPVQPWKWVRFNVKTNLTSSGTSNAIGVDGSGSDHTQLVCWNGTNEFTIPSASIQSCPAYGALQVPALTFQPVYVLTSLAVTPSGSRRMVQMDVAADTIPGIPGAMVLDGDILPADWGPGNSNAFHACGTDQASCHGSTPVPPTNGTTCPPAGSEPAIGAYDAGSLGSIQTAFQGPPDRSGNYTGSPGGSANVSTSLTNGGLTTVQGLQALVNTVTSGALAANIYNNAGGSAITSLTNTGSTGAPVTNVVTGDASLSSFSGAGILLVEGNLSFSGKPNFDGLILVIGKGSLSFSGGGNGVIDGAVLVANLYDSGGHLITSGAPGEPNIGFSGGGSMTVQYDSCWVAAMNQSSPYKSLGVREMAY